MCRKEHCLEEVAHEKAKGQKKEYSLLPASFLIILVCLVLGLIFCSEMKENMVAMGVEEAEMASTFALQSVDGDLVEKLTPGCESSEGY